jgi:hypothetical protein
MAMGALSMCNCGCQTKWFLMGCGKMNELRMNKLTDYTVHESDMEAYALDLQRSSRSK